MKHHENSLCKNHPKISSTSAVSVVVSFFDAILVELGVVGSRLAGGVPPRLNKVTNIFFLISHFVFSLRD